MISFPFSVDDFPFRFQWPRTTLNTFYSDFDRQTHIPVGETPDESLVTKFLLTVIDFMKWFLDQSSLHVSSVVQTHVRTA